MKFAITVISFFVVLAVTLCCAPGNDSGTYTLTDHEKKLCDSLQIDTTIVQYIRTKNKSRIEPFHYSLSKTFKDGQEIELDPIHLKGLVFEEKNEASYDLVLALKDNFKKAGYSIFLLENNMGLRKKWDHIGVLKTTDQLSVLKQVGTDGINHSITNDSLISIVRKFDEKYSLELIGASGDWCEFNIKKEPKDWDELANEVYQVCPDVVEQGTGSVESLKEIMKRTKRLYFWWD